MVSMKNRKAGVYLRISEDRTSSNAGVDRQEEDCLDLAASLGWTVVDIYTDNDLSAFKRSTKRPEYDRLWADVQSGRINAVITYHSKRLYRRLAYLEALIDRAEKNGNIPIKTVASGDIDLSTAAGRAVARILAALGQMESEESSERGSRQKLAARKAGRLNGGGRRPFGYKRIPGDGLQIVPEEAALIREAVARILQGETPNRIASDWNARGIQTSTGIRWRPVHLTRMLIGANEKNNPRKRKSPLLIGGANWPAILTEDEVASVRAIVDGRKKFSAKAGGRDRRYALTGLLFCSECGLRLLGSRGYYRCSKIIGGCGKVSVKARQIEDALDRRVQQKREAGEDRDPSSVPTIQVDQEEQRAALAEVAEVEARIAELEDALANGKLDPELASATFTKLKERRQAASERFVEVSPKRPEPYSWDFEAIADWHERWVAGQLTPVELEDLHSMFAAYFAAVQVSPGVRGPFDLKRIKVRWA